MPNSRDDFTKTTKQIAASRVGYRCSFPQCTAATIGASFESGRAVSTTGVAAHICAAAAGGKRYDPQMTEEERKSVDNCIWMCQTHARLIDTDEVTYTVDKLREWKKEAEIAASKQLADMRFFDNYFCKNGENLYIIEGIFNGLLAEGNYAIIGELLEQYSSDLSDNYNELVLRYRIIYDIYCKSEDLEKDVNKYINIPEKTGLNQLVSTLLTFLLKRELDLLIPYCESDELKNIAAMVIENKIMEKLIYRKGDEDKFVCSDEMFNWVKKLLSYFAFNRSIYNLKNEDDTYFGLYDEEFYYEVIAAAYRMSQSVVLETKYNEADYLFIINSIEKINTLSLNLQMEILQKVLLVLTDDKSRFEALYTACSDFVKNDVRTQMLKYVSIEASGDSVEIEDVLKCANEGGDYFAVHLCLSKFSKEKAQSFFEKNNYLFSKDSYFLYDNYLLFGVDDTMLKMQQYTELYKEDFCFNCVMALCGRKDNVPWLKKNLCLMRSFDIKPYIDVLQMFEQYDDLHEVASRLNNSDLVFHIAGILVVHKDFEQKSRELYIKLIDKGYMRAGLFYTIGRLQEESGEIEQAKDSFKKEYDSFKTEEALIALLYLRFKSHCFIEDFYLQEAKKIPNATIQNIVGATLLKLHKKEARDYLLRSLLLDSNNARCLNAIFSIGMADKELEECEAVCADSMCEIYNEHETLLLAIHRPEILEGFIPNRFGGCMHFSAEDPQISPVLFSRVDDTVELFGKSFVVKSVLPLKVFVNRVAMASVIKEPTTIAIHGNGIEESVEKIKKMLHDSCERDKRIIEEYNEGRVKYPLPTLANMLGKSMLRTWEYLTHGNSVRLPNNTGVVVSKKAEVSVVLSYDSVLTISLLNLAEHIPSNIKLICPEQVKNQLILDIDSELQELTTENHGGFLVYDEGEIGFIQHDYKSKRSRYSHLVKIKNFVNGLLTDNGGDYAHKNINIQAFVSELHIYCETASLSLSQKIPQSILLSDEPFLYSLCHSEGVNTIGITHFLTWLNMDLEQFLEKSLELSKLNFAEYFTWDMYNNAVDLMSRPNLELNMKKAALFDFLLSDTTTEEATDYHRMLIVEVFRNACVMDDSFIAKDTLLRRMAAKHYVALNPDCWENIITQKDISRG